MLLPARLTVGGGRSPSTRNVFLVFSERVRSRVMRMTIPMTHSETPWRFAPGALERRTLFFFIIVTSTEGTLTNPMEIKTFLSCGYASRRPAAPEPNDICAFHAVEIFGGTCRNRFIKGDVSECIQPVVLLFGKLLVVGNDNVLHDVKVSVEARPSMVSRSLTASSIIEVAYLETRQVFSHPGPRQMSEVLGNSVVVRVLCALDCARPYDGPRQNMTSTGSEES